MATQTDDSAQLKVEEKLEANPPAEPKTESESADSADAIKEPEKTPVVEETVAESAKEVIEKPLEGETVSRDVEVTLETKEQETIEEKSTEETLVKPVKQSNNLISKVKQSLVKAKKAILGKSAAPPTSVSTETKA